ncbi:TPA: VENN motif pre-toxin domain-containing protein, partial [Yersinia enterocolitica]
YLAEVIHNMTTDANGKVNVEANLMAHAVLGAVMAQVNGNSALAGASGAVMGEYIAQQMYPGINREDLTEEQRQTISALGTLASGLAGGLAGGSTADAMAGAQAGKNALENNSLGLGAGDIGFWLGNTPGCDTACKTDIAKGVAEGNLVVSAGIAGVAGGALIIGATPEIVAAAKAALEGCKAAPAICLNNAGLQVAEGVTPGGVGAAGAIGVGKTAAEAAAAKAEALVANAAKNAGKGTTGSLSGQPTKLPPNASVENIRSLQRENEGAAILSQNGYHVEQNPVTAGVKNPDYKINGEVFDNIAPKTNSVRNIYDRALEKVNSGQTNNVVINLADTKASISDLQKQFSDWPIKGLDKVIVIDQSGKPIQIK